MNYHYFGENGHIYGFAPDQQLFGAVFSWDNMSGLFINHVPDNGMWLDFMIVYVGSTHLIEIAYRVPVINRLDTANWITGGGYNGQVGWNFKTYINNLTTWWGIFLFSIENWHDTTYVSHGSPLTKTSYISVSHTYWRDDCVLCLTGGASDIGINYHGLFRSSIDLVSY